VNILLSRHGNTFNPGDPVVWAGSQNDLPLVEKGVIQAERFASALIEKRVSLSAIYCGPLQRTSHYASILIQKLKLPFQPRIDFRLNEIDYGDWTGLTHDQVVSRFGETDLKRWEEESRWPTQGNWGGREEQMIQEVRSFVEDLIQKHQEHDSVAVITSNGRLRYFLTLIPGEFEKRIRERAFKVKTGNICRFRHQNGILSVLNWNQDPGRLE
jgi:probable phosphoglycerate mutase